MAKKPKRYLGRVYLGQDANGKQLWHWVGRFERKRDCDAAVAKARTEKPWEEDAPADEMTCGLWADRFLARMESGALRTKSGRRFQGVEHRHGPQLAQGVQEEFGDRFPRSITRVEAEDWAEKVPPSRIPIVVTLMNELYRAEEIDRNRFEGLSRRSEGRKGERPPSEEEMVLLLEACSALGDEYAPMMRALLTFAAFTIMRPGELFALDWDLDVELEAGAHGRARVQRRLYRGQTDLPKSNKPRTITLLPPPARRSIRCCRCRTTTPMGSCSATRRAVSSPSRRLPRTGKR
jgi:integrase